MSKTAYGREGERIAESYLREKAYRILVTNYHCQYGEIDIIAKKEDCTIFIEVKRRKSNKMGMPHESVVKQKQRKIIRVAYQYASRYGLIETPMRFDVIEILDREVHHIENAFYVPDGTRYL